MKKATTKTVYCNGNSFGNQYAPGNCSPYGTKWKINIKLDEFAGMYKQIGLAKLLNANWDIDEKKVQNSFNWTCNWLM